MTNLCLSVEHLFPKMLELDLDPQFVRNVIAREHIYSTKIILAALVFIKIFSKCLTLSVYLTVIVQMITLFIYNLYTQS